MKITSKYNYNQYYLLNKRRDLSGIVLLIDKKKRILLKQKEYFQLENIKTRYNSHHLDLYYSVNSSSFVDIKDNIFGIGTSKMCNKLNRLSKRYKSAKILKLLYNLEKLKIDFQYGLGYRYRSRKIEIYKKILFELNKFDEIKISINYGKNKTTLVNEYIIKYKNYIFSFHYIFIPNLPENIKRGKFIKYNKSNYNLSKLLDLIYVEFGDYMK